MSLSFQAFFPFCFHALCFHPAASWESSSGLSWREVFSTIPSILFLWSCSTFFWDAFSGFGASHSELERFWCVFEWPCGCPWRQAIITAWNESLGGSLFCSFSRKPIVSSSEEGAVFRFVFFAIFNVCNISGLASTGGISLCNQLNLLTDFVRFFNPGQKIFWLGLFPSLKYVGSLLQKQS